MNKFTEYSRMDSGSNSVSLDRYGQQTSDSGSTAHLTDLDHDHDHSKNGHHQHHHRHIHVHEPHSIQTFRGRLFKKDNKKLLKYAASTSTHGIKYMFGGKSLIRKLFWITLFLIALAFCLNNVIGNIVVFTGNPTATTVSSVHVSYLKFPTVTVCNMNGFSIAYLERNNLTQVIQSSINLEFSSSDNLTVQFIEQCTRFKNIESRTIKIQDMVANNSQSLRELIVECKFLGVPCDLDKDFTEVLTPLGMCYTFNGNRDQEPKRVVGSGFRHELRLILNVDKDYYTGSLYQESGVRVAFHPVGHPPLPLSEGLAVPVGKSAYMGISTRQINDMSVSKTDSGDNHCIVPGDTKDMFTFVRGYNYSLAACRKNCLVEQIANICKCIPDSSLLDANTPVKYSHLEACPVSQLCCIVSTLTIARTCTCLLSCNHTQYDIMTTYSTYPSPTKREALAERYNTTVENLENSFLSLHVFFTELIVTNEITEKSYLVGRLIADIGGGLGFFLGVSIISLTELLIWIIDEIKDRCFGMNEEQMKKLCCRKCQKDEPVGVGNEKKMSDLNTSL